ncbi:hypothetical protein [Lignipirellula cremea]|uniref:PilZ domain-containing protein n=1 Tax=Lignipirellula cremea TaxID=2528010 RepID=A0A518DNP8_9BACT|nr:hypothetical protein [Lignipirellula cremea]QDU93462.1 hypothetical protein Pla8534_12420 [Lignipirellula cremea]
MPASPELHNYARHWAKKLREYNRAQTPSRHTMVAEIEATPLSPERRPVANALGVVTRDVSCTGIGFLCETPFEAPFAALQIKTMEAPVLIEVLKCEPVGAYFDVSGRFLAADDDEKTARREDLERIHTEKLRQYQEALVKLVQSIDQRLKASGESILAVPPQEMSRETIDMSRETLRETTREMARTR